MEIDEIEGTPTGLWNALRKRDYHLVTTFVQEPHPNQSAKMLGDLFRGIVTELVKPDTLTDVCPKRLEGSNWVGQSSRGLIAELLEHVRTYAG